MTDDYYYKRTAEYKPVLDRNQTGCFTVPMIHSCVLIDLRRTESDLLTYKSEKIDNFDGPLDDIITFAIGAKRSGISLVLCNDQFFGYVMVPLEQDDPLNFDYQQLINIKLEILTDNEPIVVNEELEEYTWLPEKDTLGFDEIFMINLVRRPDRRRRMLRCFDELGLEATIVDAVDGG